MLGNQSLLRDYSACCLHASRPAPHQRQQETRCCGHDTPACSEAWLRFQHTQPSWSYDYAAACESGPAFPPPLRPRSACGSAGSCRVTCLLYFHTGLVLGVLGVLDTLAAALECHDLERLQEPHEASDSVLVSSGVQSRRQQLRAGGCMGKREPRICT